MTEENEVQSIQDIVAEVVEEEDIKHNIDGLKNLARLVSAYYVSLSELQTMPEKLVRDLVMQWQEITLSDDGCEPV